MFSSSDTGSSASPPSPPDQSPNIQKTVEYATSSVQITQVTTRTTVKEEYVEYEGKVKIETTEAEMMETEQVESPESPAHQSVPTSPIEENPMSPDYQDGPISPLIEDGEASEHNVDYSQFMGDEPPSQEGSEGSDDDGEEDDDGAELEEVKYQVKKEDKLDELKDLQFKQKKSFNRPSAPPRRTVRSFLDEKGAGGELDVTAFAAREAKSEPVEPVEDEAIIEPAEPRERPEKRKKKRKHDSEKERDREREKQPPICFDSRPQHPYNPHCIALKVHSLIAKVDTMNAIEGEEINEEEIADVLFETVTLEGELEELQEKRAVLLKEMEEMFELEKENIKKMHAELPLHLQEVISIDGDVLEMVDGKENAVPTMFPPMPSMLQNDIMGPLLNSNGIPNFPLPGMNGNRTPSYAPPEECDVTKTPDYREGPRTPALPSNQISWSAPPLFNPAFLDAPQHSSLQFTPAADDGTSTLNIDNSIPMNITFAFPPLGDNTEGNDPMGSYQMPPNPGVPNMQDLSKNLSTMLFRLLSDSPQKQPAINGSPSQVQGTNNAPSAVPPSLLLVGGVSSPLTTAADQGSRPNPPSLMSLSVDPFIPGFRTSTAGGGAAAAAAQRGRTGRAGHVESPKV